jgi:hypothetical protein
MSAGSKKTFFPKTRLSQLAARPGGVTRDQAIANAAEAMEEMREECTGAIETAIAALEAILYAARGRLSEEQMKDILRHADRVVTLAGTFGYGLLDTAVRSLCDVTDGMLPAQACDVAPIAVHVQAMRLMAPGSAKLSEAEAGHVLGELSKVRAHLGIVSSADAACSAVQ